MLPTTPKRRPSLLNQQLTILGMERGDAQAAAGERARIEGIELGPLNLTGSQSSRWLSPTLVALAATLALLVVSYRLLSPGVVPDDGLRIKGASKVWVYWERDGQVEPWSEDSLLQNGDRVRAEVLAGNDAVAYLAVVSGDAILLSDPAQVTDGSMRLKAGERKSFAGSFKLVGADEKERLIVIICQAANGATPELSDVLKARGERIGLQNLPLECGVEQFGLRGSTK